MKSILVLGAGGFIGHHLVTRLKRDHPDVYVRGVDRHHPHFSRTDADDFPLVDLRDPVEVHKAVFTRDFDEVYQLAADMGGAGYIFTGRNDADIMHNSALININVLHTAATTARAGRIFFSSSACVYPEDNQLDPLNPTTAEYTAYPANPDSEYGWEKIFSERLYRAFARNHGLDVRIARYHNIFGPQCAWNDGKEKAPAAICRKIAETRDGGTIDIWGDGRQTRSFLYIDECLDGTLKLMRHPTFKGPVNIGSSEMVTIDTLVRLTAEIAGKTICIDHIPGPTGVRGRTSDNSLCYRMLNWTPSMPLVDGLGRTYAWVEVQVNQRVGTKV